MDAPPPLEWHPAYRDQTWLLDWLKGDTGYPRDHIVFPLYVSGDGPFDSPRDDAPLPIPPMQTITMCKHQAWGPAPYVGRPFVYVWTVGVDDVGRAIAGESSIQYIPTHQLPIDHPEWRP